MAKFMLLISVEYSCNNSKVSNNELEIKWKNIYDNDVEFISPTECISFPHNETILLLVENK